MSLTTKTWTAAAAVLMLTSIESGAALAPDLKCQAGKLKATASYASCLLKAEAKALTKALTPDFGRCEVKINSKFPKLEEVAGAGVCPSEMDLPDIRDRTEEFEETIDTLLSGGTLPQAGACGDGTIDPGEDCEIGDLGGESCSTQGFYNGTLACSPGCSLDTSGCNPDRFEDTGLTIVDHETNLEWEKKDSAGGGANLANPHDADNTYLWAIPASDTTQSGGLYTDFLFTLNGVVDHMTTTTSGCFASHCDWRIPTVDELKTILAAGCGSAPCVLDLLLLPTTSGRYWSNSTRALFPTGAYFVDFNMTVAHVASDTKSTKFYYARAVRNAD